MEQEGYVSESAQNGFLDAGGLPPIRRQRNPDLVSKPPSPPNPPSSPPRDSTREEEQPTQFKKGSVARARNVGPNNGWTFAKIGAKRTSKWGDCHVPLNEEKKMPVWASNPGFPEWTTGPTAKPVPRSGGGGLPRKSSVWTKIDRSESRNAAEPWIGIA